MADEAPDVLAPEKLGLFLRRAREALGLTLRQVETRTGGRIRNAHLSQIEQGKITRPTTDTLWELSSVYGVNYDELLVRAGHRVAHPGKAKKDREALDAFALHSLRELSPAELTEVESFVAYLQHRRTQHETS
ncbi:MAG: helix-turn-helix domain-containing protein [Actinomycetota bacterium]